MSGASGTGASDQAVARAKVKKAPSAFRTISEVADDLHIPQHVLRFWETKFPQVKPLKRGGGRRYYRPDDILLLRRISDLLYIQGYTIKGVQRLLREGGGKLSDNIPPPTPEEREATGGDTEDADLDEAQDADTAASASSLLLEPLLPMPGLTVPAAAGPKPVSAASRAVARAKLGSTPDPETTRLRLLLMAALAELEALRALLD